MITDSRNHHAMVCRRLVALVSCVDMSFFYHSSWVCFHVRYLTAMSSVSVREQSHLCLHIIREHFGPIVEVCMQSESMSNLRRVSHTCFFVEAVSRCLSWSVTSMHLLYLFPDTSPRKDQNSHQKLLVGYFPCALYSKRLLF